MIICLLRFPPLPGMFWVFVCVYLMLTALNNVSVSTEHIVTESNDYFCYADCFLSFLMNCLLYKISKYYKTPVRVEQIWRWRLVFLVMRLEIDHDIIQNTETMSDYCHCRFIFGSFSNYLIIHFHCERKWNSLFWQFYSYRTKKTRNIHIWET